MSAVATITAPAPTTDDAVIEGTIIDAPTSMEEQETALRQRWTSAAAGEADAADLFERANLAWQNARVVKTRVAYAAAMLVPTKDGANLLNATRVLLTDPADTKAKRTSQAKSRKNTLRNYVAAGEALDALQLAYSDDEPTEAEREAVRRVFDAAAAAKAKAAKEAAKAKRDAAKGGAATDGDDDTDAPAGGRTSDPSEPTTQKDVVDAVESLMDTVKAFTRDHGFAGVVADNLSDALAEVAALIDQHRVDGGK